MIVYVPTETGVMVPVKYCQPALTVVTDTVATEVGLEVNTTTGATVKSPQ